jgi:hypothetical protein
MFVLVSVLPVSAQDAATVPTVPTVPPVDSDWHFRFELFQMLLEEQGTKTVSSVESALAVPSQSVVVMIGDLSGTSREEWLRLLRFVAQGGRVLLASDRKCIVDGIGQFHSGPVTATRSADRYQGYADCLRIQNRGSKHPLSVGVDELVTNRAGWFTPQPGGSLSWEVAAVLPANCQPILGRSQPLVSVGRISPEDSGVVVVVSDQSIFSNNMLWHGDNAVFSIRVSELLTEGDRDRLAFLTDGVIQPGYRQSLQEAQTPDIPPVKPPIPEQLPEPELETILRVANTVIRKVEDSNVLNKALMNQPRNVRQPLYQHLLMLGLTLIAGAWILWLMMRRGATPAAPVPSRQMLSASRITGQLHAERLEFGAAAEILSRDLCRDLTGSSSPADWHKLLHSESASKFSRSQRKTLAGVLELALRGSRVHISRRRFQSLGRGIRELRSLQTNTAESRS